jgi:multidrug resistance efflux pump
MMPRLPHDPTRWRVAVGATLLAVALGGCAERAGLDVVGTVEDDTVAVSVPALGAASVDLDAGFAPDLLAAATPTGATSAVLALTGLGTAVTVRDIAVREGDRVSSGEVIATLDDAQLVAQVAAARSAADVAAAQPAVVQAAIDETYSKGREIADRRAQADDAIATLTARRRALMRARTTLVDTRAQLRAKRAQLRATRTDLREQRAQLLTKRAGALDQRAQLAQQVSNLEQVLAQLPPDPGTPLPPLPPGTPAPPTRAQVQAAIAQLQAGIAQIDAGLPQIDAGLAQVDAGLRRITSGLETIGAGLDRTGSGLQRIATGLPQVDAALAKARDGLAQLDDAAAQLMDARRALRHRKDQAETAAQTARLAVQVARRHLADATVTAPVDGVVVGAAATGDVLAPGATLVSIQPEAAARATVWLAPDELAQVCVGDSAVLHGDWMAAGMSVPATLTSIGQRWDYPPSWHATDEVHLSRALPAVLTTSSGALPAGVPVEITIDGCRRAAPQS